MGLKGWRMGPDSDVFVFFPDNPRTHPTMHTSTKITVLFCIFTLILAPFYWLGLNMFSVGPVDHIRMSYVAGPLILLHALAVARYGEAGRKNALAYLGFIALLAAANSYNMGITPGYLPWHIVRPLEALGWCVMWSLIGMTFSLGRNKDGNLGRPKMEAPPSGPLRTNLRCY